MSKTSNSQRNDATIFTQSVENVFRKLIRILVGRISLLKLQEMMNYIYVEEAELKIKKDRPGKNIPLTTLALITGLDSRTVVGIRKKIEDSSALYAQKFLKELTPESAIVEAWVHLIESAPPDEHESMATLTYGDDKSEFERLFRATIPSRGITSQSIIQRLVASGSIKQNKIEKLVSLKVRKFSPYLSSSESQVFNAAFASVSNLLSTVENNIVSDANNRLFDRQVWTFHLPKTARVAFRKQMRSFLEKTEEEARNEIMQWDDYENADLAGGAGVGFYYFEEL